MARNKISDDGATILLQALVNNTVSSLHLSSNMITERTLDCILNIIKTGQLPKNIYLS